MPTSTSSRQYAGVCIAIRPLLGLLTHAATELQTAGLIGKSKPDREAVLAVLAAPFVAYAKRPPDLSIREAWEQTGIARATLRYQCRHKKLKGAHKRGKRWFIPQSALRTCSASEDHNFGEKRASSVSIVSRNRRKPRSDRGD